MANSEINFRDKVVLISSGHRGIGRATTLAFLKAGARVAVLAPEGDANAVQLRETETAAAELGQAALSLTGDLGDVEVCNKAVQSTLAAFGGINVVINNGSGRAEPSEIADIDLERFDRAIRLSLHSTFFMTKAALPHLHKGDCVINSVSTAAYLGDGYLPDYCAAKGGVLALTRSMAAALGPKGIRVNAVAHGVRDDFSPTRFPTTLAEPWTAADMANAYLFVASHMAAAINGQVIHPTAGVAVNG